MTSFGLKILFCLITHVLRENLEILPFIIKSSPSRFKVLRFGKNSQILQARMKIFSISQGAGFFSWEQDPNGR